MATRTSSPPGSRSKSTSRRSGRGGSSTRSRSTSRKSRRAPAKSTRARGLTARTAPRAVRSGPGPVFRLFRALGHAWLAVAHALGGAARRIGRTARELEPEHRRDGAGLLLVRARGRDRRRRVVAAPGLGDVGSADRGRRLGRQGRLAGAADAGPGRLAHPAQPREQRPAGRQVVGWAALLLGVLGIVHIANGNPAPRPRRQLATCSRRAARSGSSSPACCWTCCGRRTWSCRCSCC